MTQKEMNDQITRSFSTLTILFVCAIFLLDFFLLIAGMLDKKI